MNYPQLIEAIRNTHRRAAERVATAANQGLVLRNWLVGAWVVEFEQGGADRARYGERLLPQLASDLKKQDVPGLGLSNLRSCRQFYLAYPQIRQTVSGFFGPGEIRQTLSGELALAASGAGKRAGKLSALPTPLAASDILRLSWSHWLELIRVADPWKRAFYENECLGGGWSVRQLQRQLIEADRARFARQRTTAKHPKKRRT